MTHGGCIQGRESGIEVKLRVSVSPGPWEGERRGIMAIGWDVRLQLSRMEGRLLPETLPAAKMLPYYAERFHLEIQTVSGRPARRYSTGGARPRGAIQVS